MWPLWRYGFAVEVAKAEWVSANEQVVGTLNQVVYLMIRIGRWEKAWILKKMMDIDG